MLAIAGKDRISMGSCFQDINLITNTHPGSEENGAGIVRLMQGVAVISPIII